MAGLLAAAIVDVGGTLWPDHWGLPSGLYERRLVERLGVSAIAAGDLLEELCARDPALVNPPPRVQDTVSIVRQASNAAGIAEVDPHDVIEAMDVPAAGATSLLPGARDLLKQIKREGLRTVALSNATYRTSASYARDFSALGIAHLIGHVISSVDRKLRKPDPLLFEEAARLAAAEPSRCISIGNSIENDIRPAAALGFMTLLVAVETPPPDSSDADVACTSLLDAAQVIRSIGVPEESWRPGDAVENRGSPAP